MIKVEKALLLALNATNKADITWPSEADQVLMALPVEYKVVCASSQITHLFKSNIYFVSNKILIMEPLLKGRWGFIE